MSPAGATTFSTRQARAPEDGPGEGNKRNTPASRSAVWRMILISEANQILGSQTGSQRRQMPSD
jgi:hypothetical protein